MRRVSLQLLAVVVVMLVAAGCGKFGAVYKGSSTSTTGASTTKSVTSKAFDAAAQKDAGCTPLEERKVQGRTHTTEKQKYTENPPSSGAHNPVPLDWGIYKTNQPDERWVHNLEHGHIVILYKKITTDQKTQLLKYVKRDPFHIVVLPRDKNVKDGIYYVAWDKSLYCAKPSAEALQFMIDGSRDQGPELFMNDAKKK
ncbi:MAG: DUF3105 domain-containing protein [Thermoleophilia bacterium]|nr:DUF3105 domain-containing protein [Thermoleophilia bacterium]